MNRAVFLDRDGVINRKPLEGEYVTRGKRSRFFPELQKQFPCLIEQTSKLLW